MCGAWVAGCGGDHVGKVGDTGTGDACAFRSDENAPVAEFSDKAKVRMIGISSGTFCMGSGAADAEGVYADHPVTLTHAFWLGGTEVTEKQWAAWVYATDQTPSQPSRGDDYPVDSVTWDAAVLYANVLSEEEGLTPCYSESNDTVAVAEEYDGSSLTIYDCHGYRLPTEAEWEYAARAGLDTMYAGSNYVDAVAVYSDSQKRKVGTKDPNAWGLFDMSGNVWEWTADGLGSDHNYPYDYDSETAPQSDPIEAGVPYYRVVRGGGWDHSAVSVSFREAHSPVYANGRIGFRIARSAVP